MMDRFGIGAILTTIKTAYPQFSVTSDTADLWLRILKDRDADKVYQATDEYIAANKYPPTIADINQSAMELEHKAAADRAQAARSEHYAAVEKAEREALEQEEREKEKAC